MIALRIRQGPVSLGVAAAIPVVWLVGAYAALLSTHLASDLVLPGVLIVAATGPFLGGILAHRDAPVGRMAVTLSGLLLGALVLVALLMRSWVICNEPVALAQILVVSLIAALVTGGGYACSARLVGAGLEAAGLRPALLRFVGALGLVAVCVGALLLLWPGAINPPLACAAP